MHHGSEKHFRQLGIAVGNEFLWLARSDGADDVPEEEERLVNVCRLPYGSDVTGIVVTAFLEPLATCKVDKMYLAILAVHPVRLIRWTNRLIGAIRTASATRAWREQVHGQNGVATTRLGIKTV